jgi:transcription elongation factor Elf1
VPKRTPTRPAWEQEIEKTLVCPWCGVRNTEERIVVVLDVKGTATCGACHRSGDGKVFLAQKG